ncbi:nucleoside transporter [candidate division KSB1 bacterium]|nr:nucleoside transporter [candidate division KSB1 bacterium]
MGEQKKVSGIIKRLDQTYEYDREPIAEKSLQSGRHFAGLFAGEHVAATEFVIGAMFVAWGAGTLDVLLGLVFGNLLAVLSWTLVCAPIAVETRVTLYWYLRKIAGPYVTIFYNILNAILYCILAGAMITVSASAVRLPFNIPAQTNWYPQDMRFVLVVLVVGAVVVTLAILGFKKLAQFATVCSPWMFLMFIAGALVTMPYLAKTVLADGELNSIGDFFKIANQKIWTGKAAGGKESIGFWHVMAFAWICNLAMHLGLSDMAIFRYAKRASYGLYSAFGMYLGHYLAWVAAGIMGAATAVFLQSPLKEIDSGGVAFFALGISGAIAVVIAGWTTSNPTLYRAGLALQVITPNWPRWIVTLIAGGVTTIIACFPFVFTKLLDFVGIYGLLLVPMGAIVVVEHWIFPKIGFKRFWASRKGLLMNWPALASWMIAIGVALVLWQTKILHLFFLLVPVWVITSGCYILFSYLAGATGDLPAEKEESTPQKTQAGEKQDKTQPPSILTKVSGIIALAALIACFVLPLELFLKGSENWEANLASLKNILFAVTIIYFIAGTYWVVQRDRAKTN